MQPTLPSKQTARDGKRSAREVELPGRDLGRPADIGRHQATAVESRSLRELPISPNLSAWAKRTRIGYTNGIGISCSPAPHAALYAAGRERTVWITLCRSREAAHTSSQTSGRHTSDAIRVEATG